MICWWSRSVHTPKRLVRDVISHQYGNLIREELVVRPDQVWALDIYVFLHGEEVCLSVSDHRYIFLQDCRLFALGESVHLEEDIKVAFKPPSAGSSFGQGRTCGNEYMKTLKDEYLLDSIFKSIAHAEKLCREIIT